MRGKASAHPHHILILWKDEAPSKPRINSVNKHLKLAWSLQACRSTVLCPDNDHPWKSPWPKLGNREVREIYFHLKPFCWRNICQGSSMIMGKWPLYASDHDSLSQTSLKARFPPSWLNNENPMGDFTSFSLTSQNLTCRVPPVPVICHCVNRLLQTSWLKLAIFAQIWADWAQLVVLLALAGVSHSAYLAGSELAGSQSLYSHLVP